VGHLRPVLPFAHSLKARGHNIRIAAPANLGEMIVKEGFIHLFS
jgi:UDP:flavonoid glycosyltransferase YjiC (YdhE family)